jgi:tetratricopeptide (TPR) repeat protein
VLEPIDFDYLHLWGHYALVAELRERVVGRLTDLHLQAINLRCLGLAYRTLGQVEQAIQLCERALVIACESGDRKEEGAIIGNLGIAYRVTGYVEQAINCFERALTVARETGDRLNEHDWLGNLGDAHSALGQVEWAIEFYEEALEVTDEIGYRRYESAWLGNLGSVYIALGRFERAIELLEDALTISCEVGNRKREAKTLGSLGLVCHIQGQMEQAISLFKRSLTISREIGYRKGESYDLLRLGQAMLTVRSLSEARRCCAEALALNVPETSYQAALMLGIVFLHQRALTAGETFAGTIARCRDLLDRTASLYAPRYALATALVGKAVCDPCWEEERERVDLLAPALAEYRGALENCSAPGVVRDALWKLEIIRAAGIEGLEPAFELLEGAV